jgi:flagellin-like protein
MKGISPLIAAVLLIAFTIAVGGIVSIFMTSFTKQTTGSVSSQGGALIACGSSAPTVDVVNAYKALGNVSFTVSNPGSLPLYSIAAYVSLSNASTFTVNSLSGTTLAAYASNSTVYAYCYNCAWAGNATITEVRVVGVCVTSAGQNQTVSGSCLAGQACMFQV